MFVKQKTRFIDHIFVPAERSVALLNCVCQNINSMIPFHATFDMKINETDHQQNKRKLETSDNLVCPRKSEVNKNFLLFS